MKIDWRKAEETLFRGLMTAAFAVMASMLALIVAVVAAKGLPYMDAQMVLSAPKGGFYLGREGGVLNAIVGSLYLSTLACLLALLLALPSALFINVYLKKSSRLAAFLRFAFDVLTGAPSIVYGAFGFAIMLSLGMGASLLAGAVTVALLVAPMMARAMDEVMRMAPRELLDVSYSLGSTRAEASFKVMARQCLPGICTAILLSFGRAIGDAASVLFTAGFTDSIPVSPLDPAATLPLAIFFQLGTPMPEVQGRAYASALILTLLILTISLGARLLARRLSAHTIK